MKRAALITLAVALLGVAPAPSASANHAIGWHWKRAVNPFTVTVLDSVAPAWKNHLLAAAGDWSQSGKLDMNVVPSGASASQRRRCAPTSLKVHICSFNYGAVGWAGITLVSMDSAHHIKTVAVKLNDYYVNTPALRRIVSCHELGHTLGLAHRAESTSCMKVGVTSRHPDGHDYRELNIIYRHPDNRAPDGTSIGTTTVEYRTLPPR